MNDNFEKFIRKNRKEFDTESPSSGVWENIESSLPDNRPVRRFTLRDIYKWSAAAAVLFVILTSLYFLVFRKNSHESPVNNSTVDIVNPDESSTIAPEYVAEFKQVYESIETRQVQLKSVTADKPQLYKQFCEDLGALDSTYQVLKRQAGNSPNRDVIFKAMIQNLRLQAELLGRQLMISTEFNNSKKSKNEQTI
jgi:hypothetical protein